MKYLSLLETAHQGIFAFDEHPSHADICDSRFTLKTAYSNRKNDLNPHTFSFFIIDSFYPSARVYPGPVAFCCGLFFYIICGMFRQWFWLGMQTISILKDLFDGPQIFRKG